MKIITLFSSFVHIPSTIYAGAAFNDEQVTHSLLKRFKQAADTLGLKVDMRSPDWPDFESWVEDLEEEARHADGERG